MIKITITGDTAPEIIEQLSGLLQKAGIQADPQKKKAQTAPKSEPKKAEPKKAKASEPITTNETSAEPNAHAAAAPQKQSETNAPSVSLQEVLNAAAALVKKNRSALAELLKKYELARVTELKPEHFESFLKDVQEASNAG